MVSLTIRTLLLAVLMVMGTAGCNRDAHAALEDGITIIDDSQVIAHVHGEPVVFGEYRQELARNYTAALTRAVTAGGIQGRDFWTTPIPGDAKTPGGITPLDLIKSMAMESSLRRKAMQLWARELGIVEDISWEAFLAAFNGENLRRANTASAGEPVFGPRQFTQDVFYRLSLTEAEYDIIQILEAEMVFDEDELYRLFHEYYRQSTYHPGIVTMDYALIRLDSENAYHNIHALRQAVADGEEMSLVAPGFGASYYRRTINLLRLPALGLPDSLMQAAAFLGPGEVSPVHEEGILYSIYQCFEREDGDFLPFERARPRIVMDEIRDAFAAQLDIRMKDALVINEDLYSQITTQMILQNITG